jgi:hypothetical protein
MGFAVRTQQAASVHQVHCNKSVCLRSCREGR